MEHEHLDQVLEIENVCQIHPWTQKNFQDCLDSKYWNYILLDDEHKRLVGYCIVMPGVEELHLLNISVDPTFQRKGVARRALQAIEQTGLSKKYNKILLEVRKSNSAALALYKGLHYELIGTRKDYYPAIDPNTREDALVLQKELK
jgi:ribosomal-protein-alanine N-acetyltransferase